MFIIDVVHDAGMRLEGVDLNLLVVLDALLTEPTVTRAARRLGLSQSATSHGLARLRHLLHDPVLVRTPQGMVPTERARALAPEVRAILEQTARALRPLPAFDPSTHSATFRLGLDDATQAGVLPQLAAAFASRAPQMRIVTEATPPAELGEALASGRLDAAISLAPDTRRGVHREPLLRYRSVCLVRRGHPQLAERLTLAGYLAAGHVVIATPGSSDADVERALDRRRRVRRVVVSTSSPLAVPGIVSRTDLIATVPDRILPLLDQRLPLVVHAPPLALPSTTVCLLWHERTVHDPAMDFLRAAIRALFAAPAKPPAARRSAPRRRVAS